MGEPQFRNARFYYTALRRRELDRVQIFELMKTKLKTQDGFGESTFEKEWPDKEEFPTDSVVLTRTYYYFESGEYTQVWFLFTTADQRVYTVQKTSDRDWDNYAYSYDQGLPPMPEHLAFAKALVRIFNFEAPTAA